MGFSLSNTIEAKIRDKDTTATEPKKIALLNNLNFSTAYSFSADSLKWSNVQFSGSVPVIPKLDLNFSGSLDPYALDNNNQKINTFNIDNGGSLFRLVNANLSFNYAFSSKDFEGKKEEEDDFDSDTFRNGGRPDDLFGETQNLNDLGNRNEREQKDDGVKSWYQYAIPGI